MIYDMVITVFCIIATGRLKYSQQQGGSCLALEVSPRTSYLYSLEFLVSKYWRRSMSAKESHGNNVDLYSCE